MSDGLATGLATSKGGKGLKSPKVLADLLAWYDAQDLGTITEAAGKVSQWDDKSGNGYHVSQGAGANQPSLSTLNGLSAIEFVKANNTHLDGVSWSPQSPTTIFLVYELTSPLNSAFGRVFWGGSDDRLRYQKRSGSNAHGRRMHENSSINGSSFSTDPEYASLVYNAASSFGRVNGVQDLSGNVGTRTPSATELSIGAEADGSIALDFTLGEFIWYDRLLTDNEILLMETYLANRWGI